MREMLVSFNFTRDDGQDDGGHAYGPGVSISWQRGPAGPDRDKINGAFVEPVIGAVIDRLAHFQKGPFANKANGEAIEHLEKALDLLNERLADRKKRGVLGVEKE